jgi:hypothetical protein
MSDILIRIQNRISELRDVEKEEADAALLIALRSIERIREARLAREEHQAMRLEWQSALKQMAAKPKYDDDDLLTSDQVYELIGHGRTYLWELGVAGFLKPTVSRPNFKRYRFRDVQAFKARDPDEVALAVSHTRKAKEFHTA